MSARRRNTWKARPRYCLDSVIAGRPRATYNAKEGITNGKSIKYNGACRARPARRVLPRRRGRLSRTGSGKIAAMEGGRSRTERKPNQRNHGHEMECEPRDT